MNSEQLPGGATAWRKDVLENYSIPDIASKWAVCEDLIFSYPVGKNEPLFVCAQAKVKHIDDIRKLGFYKCFVRGKNIVLWKSYFVSLNPDLSNLLLLWMNFGQLLGRAVRLIRGEINELGYLVGTFLGMIIILRSILFVKNSRVVMQRLLNDHSDISKFK